MIRWRQKLGSRKFWALVAALAVNVMVAFGADAQSVERVAAVIAATGACVAYMLAEAGVDRVREEEFLHLDGQEYDETVDDQ